MTDFKLDKGLFRKQRVVANIATSDWKTVIGVPQGSVLGPVLFGVYMNDLQNVIQYDACLLANNTKKYSGQTHFIFKKIHWCDQLSLKLNPENVNIYILGN